jgi:hypothetical protein
MLDCYLPIFAGSGGRCSSINDQAERKCAKQVFAYQNCAEASLPSPPPGPNCSGSGSGSANSCNVTNMCSDGSFYAVNCFQTAANQAQCTCLSGAGMNVQITLNESAANACFDAAASCGVPGYAGYDGGGPK